MTSWTKFVLGFALILAAISLAAPLLGAHPHSVGVTYNVDDHMVYAAWMRQAMDGAFFFDNRFTFDEQPRMTVHLYFWVLGIVAKGLGVIWTPIIARALFTFFAVWLLGRWIERITEDSLARRLALVFGCLGGGVGYLVWHNFGVAIVKPSPLSGLLAGRLPIDVWQPEAFFFPSLITNGLFMVSLTLMLLVFLKGLDAQSGWKPVAWGALAMGLLMNIHSYDVLLVALVWLGFGVSQLSPYANLKTALASTTATVDRGHLARWAARVGVMGLGAIPAAAWFLHVLSKDRVFQMRAETPTYSPQFMSVLMGLLPAILLITVDWARRRQFAGLGLVLLWVVLGLVSRSHDPNGFWLSGPAFGVLLGVSLATCWFLAQPNPALSLVHCWAIIGLIAPFFPALFQRKLAMGLFVPFGILAGLALAQILASVPKEKRRLPVALAALFVCGSSVLWLVRDAMLRSLNVSNTTLHTTSLSPDLKTIVEYLSGRNARVIAPPGNWNPDPEPDRFREPIIPDWNPILSGLTGSYTLAGHWSETPAYAKRRELMRKAFYAPEATESTQLGLIQLYGLDYAVVPKLSAESKPYWASFEGMGKPVFTGEHWILLDLKSRE